MKCKNIFYICLLTNKQFFNFFNFDKFTTPFYNPPETSELQKLTHSLKLALTSFVLIQNLLLSNTLNYWNWMFHFCWDISLAFDTKLNRHVTLKPHLSSPSLTIQNYFLRFWSFIWSNHNYRVILEIRLQRPQRPVVMVHSDCYSWLSIYTNITVIGNSSYIYITPSNFSPT